MSNKDELLILVKADIKQAVRELKQVAGNVKQTGDESARSAANVEKLGSSLDTLKRIVAGYLSFQFAKKILLEADAYGVLQQRIKTATKETGDYVAVSQSLYNISQRNGTQLATSVSLFQSLARSAPELQATNDEMLTLTNAVQQLGIISGTSTANLNAGLLQFSQGLSAGVFRAEEFNSIMENMPEVATRIAKGMNLTVGELRNAVLAGKVLSKDVFDSLVKQAPEIADEFADIDGSIARSATAMANSFANLAGYLSETYGWVEKISKGMDDISDAADYYVTMERGGVAAIDTIKAKVAELKAELEQLEGGDSPWWEFDFLPGSQTEFLENRIAGLQQMVDELEKIKAIQDGVTGDRADPSTGGGADGEPSKERQEAEKKIAAITQALQDQAATYGQNAEQIALYKLEVLEASDAQIELARSASESVAAQQKAAEIQREAADIYERTRTEQEQLAAKLENLDVLLEQGAIDWDTYSRAVFNAQEEFNGLAESGDKAMAELIAAARGWGDEFTNTLADMVMQGKLDFRSLADSIISDLLRIQIQQSITTPLFAGLRIPGFSAPTKHTGGVVGTGTGTFKTVDPRVFLGARRHHTGGIAGLSANEVPTILERGEEVLTENDPRHRNNSGGSMPLSVEIINSGQPQKVIDSQASMDINGMVVKVFTDDWQRGGTIRNTIEGSR